MNFRQLPVLLIIASVTAACIEAPPQASPVDTGSSESRPDMDVRDAEIADTDGQTDLTMIPDVATSARDLGISGLEIQRVC